MPDIARESPHGEGIVPAQDSERHLAEVLELVEGSSFSDAATRARDAASLHADLNYSANKYLDNFHKVVEEIFALGQNLEHIEKSVELVGKFRKELGNVSGNTSREQEHLDAMAENAVKTLGHLKEVIDDVGEYIRQLEGRSGYNYANAGITSGVEAFRKRGDAVGSALVAPLREQYEKIRAALNAQLPGDVSPDATKPGQ